MQVLMRMAPQHAPTTYVDILHDEDADEHIMSPESLTGTWTSWRLNGRQCWSSKGGRNEKRPRWAGPPLSQGGQVDLAISILPVPLTKINVLGRFAQ